MIKDHILVWNNCLDLIRKSISSQPFKTWFEPIKPVKLAGEVITIEVPNKFFYEWLEEHYVDILRKAVKKELGYNGRLEYNILVENHRKIGGGTKEKSKDAAVPVLDEPKLINPFVIPGIKKIKIDSQLNANYTFDKFVLGDCNKFPGSAGLAIAKKPGGTAFNPLVIYGDVGLGKTHLAHAIGNEILQNLEEKQVLYVTTEKFTNQVIQAIKGNSVNDFINFYHMIDVLIIDDIQFLSNRPKTQEIFFNIFNQLHQTGKQIILTSDRSPKDLTDVDERLISRFKWGLVADLKAPDLETRIKILDMKLEKEALSLPSDIKEYICTHIKNNIRELEGVVISLVAQSTLNKRNIDIKLVKEVIRQFVSQVDKEISVENIKQLVAKFFDVPIEKMQSKTRMREVVMARQLSMYLAKNYTNSSLKVIGDSFGGRDHSTVIHSLKTVKDMMDTDTIFKDKVNSLVKKVQSTLVNV
ncbi:MAG TPA: chromosomal replication initiator protein DnaA [Saprospiraceae bacterium]|jgi:chromosomal replication initiator protein|nr:chromosomal replication initiator protein DnaA [Saprospiraceae bacterium]HMT71113.1 chromosomal replication initiator protein DnaA [Saprospiraceae bacterium]